MSDPARTGGPSTLKLIAECIAWCLEDPTIIQTVAERYIIGARTVEDRTDYWIVR